MGVLSAPLTTHCDGTVAGAAQSRLPPWARGLCGDLARPVGKVFELPSWGIASGFHANQCLSDGTV